MPEEEGTTGIAKVKIELPDGNYLEISIPIYVWDEEAKDILFRDLYGASLEIVKFYEEHGQKLSTP